MIQDCDSLSVHAPTYAIIGNKSQVRVSDNRHCDSRKLVRNERMSDFAGLRPEAANIFRRLEALNLKQRKLAEALNIEENKITKTKTGERQFKAHEVLAAHAWLDEQERQRAHIGNSPDTPKTRSADAGETANITSLDLSLSFGPGTPIEDFVESEPVAFDLSLLRAITRSPFDRLRVVRGIGNSMEPKFYTGDRILVDTSERSLSRIDGYYWITLWGSHGLKRLRPIGGGRIEVISENADFKPIEVDASELTIEGRAIWFARDL